MSQYFRPTFSAGTVLWQKCLRRLTALLRYSFFFQNKAPLRNSNPNQPGALNAVLINVINIADRVLFMTATRPADCGRLIPQCRRPRVLFI